MSNAVMRVSIATRTVERERDVPRLRSAAFHSSMTISIRSAWSRWAALLAASLPCTSTLATPLDDERLCARALALANEGGLADTIVRPVAASEGDVARWRSDPERWGYIAGTYALDRRGGTTQRLFAVEQGGTCRSTGLVRDDFTHLTLEPLVESDEGFGLDTVPARIDGTWVALAVWRDRWRFTPLALGRIDADGLVPLCRFEATGEVRREVVSPGGAICDALVAGRVEHVEWQAVPDDAMPATHLPAHDALRAELDWSGLGPRTTWKLRYESAAACGMTYEWLALDASTEEGAAIDTETPAGRALFPAVEEEVFRRGPWWIDAVFVHGARAWLAGQPQWGETKVGDYAVYRIDQEGMRVECRYRHAPRFRRLPR